MIRALFIVLAVVVAVLAWVMSMPWLYLLAGVLVLAALGLLVMNWQRAQRKANQPYTGRNYSREDELDALGIMDIRERTSAEEAASEERRDASARPKAEPRGPEAQQKTTGTAARPAKPSAPAPRPSAASPATPSERHAPSEDRAPEDQAPKGQALGTSAAAGSEEAGVQGALRPLLQALRTALGAQTTALLVQPEMALEYRIEALASTHERARTHGAFSADAPLLSAHAESQPATTAAVGDGGLPRARLGYYRAPVPEGIAQIAFAPVDRRGEPSTYFLVADAGADGFADPEPEALMKHFADLLSLLLNRHDRLARPEQKRARAGEQPETAETETAETETAETEAAESSETEAPKVYENDSSTVAETPASGDGQAGVAAHEARPHGGADDDSAAARPRREIIAEEIDRAGDGPLALALVYLNRAERVAESGAERVAEAEQALRRRLEEAAPSCRIARFGELTYGLFYTGPTDEVEAWAADVERALADAEPPLGGGVSIGIAVPHGSDADPEALRAQATEALREAYTTGLCTILG